MLDRRTYFIREHVGLLKLHEAYDILDPESGQLLAQAQEEASTLKKILKLVVNKTILPFTIRVRDENGNVLVSIQRGLTFLRSRVRVLDAQEKLLGSFQQRLLSIGGRFDILDASDQKVAQLKGNLVGWDFAFSDNAGNELGKVTRKWGGIGKELFTSADNYVVSLKDGVDPRALGLLLLAAALCVDMVLKEAK